MLKYLEGPVNLYEMTKNNKKFKFDFSLILTLILDECKLLFYLILLFNFFLFCFFIIFLLLFGEL